MVSYTLTPPMAAAYPQVGTGVAMSAAEPTWRHGMSTPVVDLRPLSVIPSRDRNALFAAKQASPPREGHR